MGLDGISINQLRAVPEHNSAELNSLTGPSLNENRIVDGLSSGQRVNPDKEHEHNNGSQQSKQQNNEDEEDDDEQTVDEIVTKYDLSDTNKFIIKLDDKTKKITILEKTSGDIIQTIDADDLIKFVQYSPSPYGSIINKKL